MKYLKTMKDHEDVPVPPVEFVFVNGPLLNDGSLMYDNLPKGTGEIDERGETADEAEEKRCSAEEEQARKQRMWFHEPGSKHSQTNERLAGVDASLLWLSQCWNSSLASDPYHGIFAFSQGGGAF